MQTFVLHTGGNAGNAGGFAGGVIEHAGKTYRGPWPILAAAHVWHDFFRGLPQFGRLFGEWLVYLSLYIVRSFECGGFMRVSSLEFA
jgi:hypothetical protein